MPFFLQQINVYVMQKINQKIRLFSKLLKRNWWLILLCTFAITGVIIAQFSFEIKDPGVHNKWLNRIYETFRLFSLNYQFDWLKMKYNKYIDLARWLIFMSYILLAGKFIFTVIIPKYITFLTIRFYKNHTVICGLNSVSMELIKKNPNAKIVVIAQEDNQYTESLSQRKVKLIVGDAADEIILALASVKTAKKIYILTENDKKNVDIAQATFSICKKNRQVASPLKCYTLINDPVQKTILKDVALFKYAVDEGEKFFFDGILFNIDEAGIKYGIKRNIEKIWAVESGKQPEILIVGLTEKTRNVILNLAHCTTMDGQQIHFYIWENDKNKSENFSKNNEFLNDFVKITFVDSEKAVTDRKYSSILVCVDNHLKSIEYSSNIRYLSGNNDTNILVFHDGFDCLNEILNVKEKNILPFYEKNIFLINTFEETVNYVLELDEEGEIEKWAEEAHNMWREKDENGNFVKNDEYKKNAEHFKQSNRNQVLDFYIKAYIAFGETFENVQKNANIACSEEMKEVLGKMEHRRWEIEKYADGWKFGTKRNNEFKIHTDLQEWENLSEETKDKDFNAINLMLKKLQNR